MSGPTVLLWLDAAAVYQHAAERAGLSPKVDLVTLGGRDVPDPSLLARVDALLAWRVPPGTLAHAPRLRWIQALTAGVEGWLDRPDLAPEVTLTCARGTHRVQMPENILAALFHLTKPFAAASLDQRESRWTSRVSTPLAGKTLGILGLGAVGREVARKAAALDLTVIGTRLRSGPVPHVTQVFGPEATDTVLGRADFVLLLLPVTGETRDLIDRRRLSAMRPEAYLLNFARGALVVDADLVAAVRSGTIAGAVLDVFRTEPLPPEHPFWTTPGITVLPHLGGLHPARDEQVARLFVDNLTRFVAGEPLAEVVDRKRGY